MTKDGKQGFDEVPRQVVETVAHILGPQSASAQALTEANAHNGPVRFWRERGGSKFIVELLK